MFVSVLVLVLVNIFGSFYAPAFADDTYERICLSQGWTPICAEWTIYNADGVQTNRVIGPNELSALLAICGNTGCGLGVGGRAEKGRTYSDEPGAAEARAAATEAARKAYEEYLANQSKTPTPPSGPSGLGGYAVIHPDGHVCGVIVATSADPFGNGGFMPNEYMGCPAWSRIVFQTTPSETGNVAGYSGQSVTYDSKTNSYSISNNSGSSSSGGNSENQRNDQKTQVTLIIKDGVATDSTGKSFDTGTGISTSTTLTTSQYQQLVKEVVRRDSAETQRQKAIEQAQMLAKQTPGIERCVSWSGYFENGKECSISNFNSNSDSLTVSSRSILNSLAADTSTALTLTTEISTDSATPTTKSESFTVVSKAANEFVNIKLEIEAVSEKGDAREMSELASKVEDKRVNVTDITNNLTKLDNLRKVTASTSVKLPDAKIADEFALSLTPSVCSISNLVVVRVAKGKCMVSYTLKSPAGNSYTSEKEFIFR